MGLSCSCDDGCEGWWYYIPSVADFEPLDSLKRKRCASCKVLIDIGSKHITFQRFRSPNSYIEERIYGDEVPLSNWQLCESCGEIYLNLDALGYCYILGDDLRQNLKEYWSLTGFKPDNKIIQPISSNDAAD